MDNYCIKDEYKSRDSAVYFDARASCDEYQDDIYKLAKQISDDNDLRFIVDVGTGSGFKLMKYFHDKPTVGIEVEPTLGWLRNKYMQRTWKTMEGASGQRADLVICADVIEHVVNPDELLEQIKQFNPEHVLFSTPDRDRVEYGKDGPPNNPYHVREWAGPEFMEYMKKHFTVYQWGSTGNTQFIMGKKLCLK